MAINNLITIIFIFIEALLISTSISAKKFIVGDDNGWSLNFDYQSWAKSKEFVVGDQIVFKYPIGKHNVIKVDETGFLRCLALSANELLATGYDVVTLTTPGRKWFISGIGKHCETGGMKLVIDVLPQSTQAPVVAPVPYFAHLRKTTHKVGDDKGWTSNIDYKAWAAGKKFVVGDSLVFIYTKEHNVFVVDGPAFQGCTTPDPKKALTSGHDTVSLTAPGKKWYICGPHCKSGMKLEINVLAAP